MVRSQINEEEVNRRISQTLSQYFKHKSNDWKTSISNDVKHRLIKQIEMAIKNPEIPIEDRNWLCEQIERRKAVFTYRENDSIVQFEIDLDKLFQNMAKRRSIDLNNIDEEIRMVYLKSMLEVLVSISILVDMMIEVAITRYTRQETKDGFSMRKARNMVYFLSSLLENDDMYDEFKETFIDLKRSLDFIVNNIHDKTFISNIKAYRSFVREYQNVNHMLESLKTVRLPEIQVSTTIKA